MKLFLIVLLSTLSYQCCYGDSVFEGELSEDLQLENGTSIKSGFDVSNETTFNVYSALEMHGNKVVEKVKEGIKTVKDKLKDGLEKVKDKIKDFKDKIGSKGGGSGSRDKYDRDYDRDRYDRDRYDRENNRKDSSYSGGGAWSNSNAEWIVGGIAIFILVASLGFLLFLKVKEIQDWSIICKTIETKE